MSDDWRKYIVTEDPELEAHLRAKLRARPEDGGLGSARLAEYAYTLGLYPPGYEEGQVHGIGLHGTADSEREYLFWDVGLEPVDEDDPNDYLDRYDGDDDDDDGDSSALWDAALDAAGPPPAPTDKYPLA
jgi:hypothetical protein